MREREKESRVQVTFSVTLSNVTPPNIYFLIICEF